MTGDVIKCDDGGDGAPVVGMIGWQLWIVLNYRSFSHFLSQNFKRKSSHCRFFSSIFCLSMMRVIVIRLSISVRYPYYRKIHVFLKRNCSLSRANSMEM